MRDEDFLRALRDTSGDATLRLAYADWLEERDDPRHELVRVCEAMRRVPVWSDRYWRLKGRRNELWERCPIDWLEATGYDGSYYDPVFRDGVPDGWRQRWRLIREFTERWHGIDVPDGGGQQQQVRQVEERLGLRLPPSVREYVAFAHDLGDHGTPTHDSRLSLEMLFHCAHYQVAHLRYHRAVSLIFYTLDGWVLGVFHDDLGDIDPRAYHFSDSWSDDVDYNEAGVPTPRPETPVFCAPSLSLSIFLNLFTELPAAGSMGTTLANPDDLLARLVADFPVHARFDDADVYETDEVLVLVSGPRGGDGVRPGQCVRAIVRRPIPIESVPAYLFGTDDRDTMSSGLLGPAWFRRQEEEQQHQPGARQPSRWTSVLRRREAERTAPVEPPPAPPALPPGDGGADIPF